MIKRKCEIKIHEMFPKIEMVIFKKDKVIKKNFEAINKDGVISFNLGSFTLAVKQEDLIRLL